jgi:hypothetical protein
MAKWQSLANTGPNGAWNKCLHITLIFLKNFKWFNVYLYKTFNLDAAAENVTWQNICIQNTREGLHVQMFTLWMHSKQVHNHKTDQLKPQDIYFYTFYFRLAN